MARTVEADGASLYLLGRAHGGVFRRAGDIHSFMVRWRSDSPADASRNHRERRKRSGMVDLLGMFRRRPAKRGAPGFARSRDDITALGDSFGDMLKSPVRDGPPMARSASLPGLELPPRPDVEPPREERARSRAQAPRPKSNAKANGGEAPRLIKRPGFLAVHSVEKSFGTRQVVRGVSIYVRRGEAVGLLGPNGAGKTTVFYMITGLIPADQGKIQFENHDITHLPMYQRARLGIGYLPQEASIFRGLNVEDNIRAVLEVVEPSKKKREMELDKLLEEFNITRLRKTPSIALSGGERRRTEIARALATRPAYMLLDEPFAGIDPIAVGELPPLLTSPETT